MFGYVGRWLKTLFGDLANGYSYKPCGDCGELTYNDLLCDHCKAYAEGEVRLVETQLGEVVAECCNNCSPTKGCLCITCDGAWPCTQCNCIA